MEYKNYVNKNNLIAVAATTVALLVVAVLYGIFKSNTLYTLIGLIPVGMTVFIFIDLLKTYRIRMQVKSYNNAIPCLNAKIERRQLRFGYFFIITGSFETRDNIVIEVCSVKLNKDITDGKPFELKAWVNPTKPTEYGLEVYTNASIFYC